MLRKLSIGSVLLFGEFANGIRIPAQTRVLALTATFVNEIKSLWLIDFFG
ncbi:MULTISPECIES: hypothetical protein [unclassified Nostoc]|nr:hypothetical protein [Nostoc sp. 'Lobaria pulmonaria (5183) cyanobiont']